MQHDEERGVSPQVDPLPGIIAGRVAALVGRLRTVRKDPLKSARGAIRASAASLRSLGSPVRKVSRSGVRLTAVCQTLSRNLIELQTEMFSSALADAALRLERASRAGGLVELLRDQADLVPATRTRITADARRVARIFREAGREARAVATQTYRGIRTPEPAPAAAQRRPRKAAAQKSAGKKAAARAPGRRPKRRPSRLT
jgi:hypothetical protein